MVKRILSGIVLVSFLLNTVCFANEAATSTLATQPGSRVDATRTDIAGTATEAIGEGRPLMALLTGEMPAKIDTSILPAATINKVYASIDLSLKKLSAHRFNEADLDEMKEATISRLKDLRKNLTGESSLYFFHTIFLNEDNFLYGFNHSAWANSPDIGLSVEYVNFLSVEALAEVLAHEMAPKAKLLSKLKTYMAGAALTPELVRELHRKTYLEFQAPVFWANGNNIVKKETNDFTNEIKKTHVKPSFSFVGGSEFIINGRPVTDLIRDLDKLPAGPVPQITRMRVAHNAGMNIVDLVAERLRPDGSVEEIHLFDTKPVEELNRLFSNNPAGPFTLAGCIVDWCNRTGKGELLPGVELEVKLLNGSTVKYPAMEFTLPGGRKVTMAANNNSSALHGDYHLRKQDSITSLVPSDELSIGTCGDLEVRSPDMATPLQPWESPYKMHVEARLGADNSMWMVAEKTNTGKTESVHGRLTFHGYITPGRTNSRATTRLSMQAITRAEIAAASDEQNIAHPEWGGVDYATCEATGNIAPIRGTRFDVSQPGGLQLGTPERTIDDLFKGVEQGPNGEVAEEIIYPEAGFKVRVTSWSRLVNPDTGEEEILKSGVQNYAPADRNVVCVEPAPGNNFFFGKRPDGKPLWAEPEKDMVNIPPRWTYQFMWKMQVLPIDANELPKEQAPLSEPAARGISADSPGKTPGDSKVDADPIRDITARINGDSTAIVDPIVASAEKTNVAVIVQKSLWDELRANDAALANKYVTQIQCMRSRFGEGSVTFVDSNRPEDFAAKLNDLMNKGYSVVGIAKSSLAAGLSGKVRGSIDRFRVAGIDLSTREDLTDAFQYVNFNYIVLMELAAMSGNEEVFTRAYRIVTGTVPQSGEMGLWFLRILPRVVKIDGDYKAMQKAIDDLFKASA